MDVIIAGHPSTKKNYYKNFKFLKYKTVEFVNENDMLGLGNFMYLKAYDFAYLLATKQAEKEFNNGELNDE
jgi:hypothetical protein